MQFCPDWIFDAAMSRCAEEFLASDLPVSALAKKYAAGLSEKYSEVKLEELVNGVENVVRFLDEVQAGEDAVKFLRGFCFFRLKFEAANKQRKLRPIFGAAEDPVKTQTYSAEETVKRIKAYVFALRSNSAPLAPAGWDVTQETDLPNFVEIASRSVSILDGF